MPEINPSVDRKGAEIHSLASAVHKGWNNGRIVGALRRTGVKFQPTFARGAVVSGKKIEIGIEHPFRKAGKDTDIPPLYPARSNAVRNVFRQMHKPQWQKLPVRKLPVCLPVPQRCFHNSKVAAVKKFNFADKVFIGKEEPQRIGYTDIRNKGWER